VTITGASGILESHDNHESHRKCPSHARLQTLGDAEQSGGDKRRQRLEPPSRLLALNGFTGSVGLSASGPCQAFRRAQQRFSPTSTTGTSTLTLAADEQHSDHPEILS